MLGFRHFFFLYKGRILSARILSGNTNRSIKIRVDKSVSSKPFTTILVSIFSIVFLFLCRCNVNMYYAVWEQNVISDKNSKMNEISY